MKSAHFIVVAAAVFRRCRGKSQRAIHATAASLASGLVPLAFLSPKIIEAIANGTARAGLTVSRLTQTQLCLLKTPKGRDV